MAASTERSGFSYLSIRPAVRYAIDSIAYAVIDIFANFSWITQSIFKDVNWSKWGNPAGQRFYIPRFKWRNGVKLWRWSDTILLRNRLGFKQEEKPPNLLNFEIRYVI